MRVARTAAVVLLLVASAFADVRVQLHLKRSTPEAEIEREFVQRSTPGTSKYRQHLNMEQLTSLVSGSGKAIESAGKFLDASGVSEKKLVNTRDVYTAVITRESPVAASLGLSAAMFEPSLVRHTVRVPAALANAVERITIVPPKHAKEGARPRHHMSKAGNPFPGMTQDPNTIKTRYNIPNASVSASQTQGVGEFQSSYFSQSWIQTFSDRYSLPVPDVRVSGPNSESPDDLEGTLDVEYITALADGATTWWVSANSTNPDPFGIDFTYWCDQVQSLSPMPKVVSISWGIGENNYAGKVDVLDSDNDAFRKLGLLGVTVFAASGDTGPGSRGYTSCTRFDPGWPATSPYLTAVGATYANAESEGEIAVSFSGGGFSDYFGRPSWQDTAVQTYLSSASGIPAQSFYNASGRGFPDVSALGTNFMVYGYNQFNTLAWMQIAGTSCASPTFAAVITRVNGELVAAGKSTVGFLNPTIYAAGKVGYDVTQGKSEDPDCFGFDFSGFPAAAGWDPVSGLGTPDYTFLLSKLDNQ